MSAAGFPEISSLTPERAAELFGVLSTPVRLQIIRILCHGEQNVTHLLAHIEASQPNMSRHLQVLYQAGVLSKRRSGHQIFYRLAADSQALICKLLCSNFEGGGTEFEVPV